MIRKVKKMTITKFKNLKTDSLIEVQLNKALDKIEELSKESSDNYNRVQNLKGKVATLEQEKDSLVKLANNRYDEIEKLKNDLHDANETIYQYASDPKRENLANEIINLKEKNKDLTNALKSSLSQTAYLVETIKTFDADFFKIKDFNNS